MEITFTPGFFTVFCYVLALLNAVGVLGSFVMIFEFLSKKAKDVRLEEIAVPIFLMVFFSCNTSFLYHLASHSSVLFPQ